MFDCSIVKGAEKFCLQTNMANKTIVAVSTLLNKDSAVPVEDDSSEDELERVIPLLTTSCFGSREDGVRMPDYFETVVPRYSDKVFKSHFRLHRRSVKKISVLLSKSVNLTKPNRRGRPPILLHKQICIFLWYASSQEPLRTIADRFDHTESSILNIVRRVTSAIHELLVKDLIKWPSGQELSNISNGFYSMRGLKGVVGAIDGTHISITGPKLYTENYINRKGYASLILQAVCGHSLVIVWS